jgi:hypothetical protein
MKLGDLSEEQKQLQSEALKFARNELSVGMKEWDKKVFFFDVVLAIFSSGCR